MWSSSALSPRFVSVVPGLLSGLVQAPNELLRAKSQALILAQPRMLAVISRQVLAVGTFPFPPVNSSLPSSLAITIILHNHIYDAITARTTTLSLTTTILLLFIQKLDYPFLSLHQSISTNYRSMISTQTLTNPKQTRSPLACL